MDAERERLMILVNESLNSLYINEKYLFDNNSSEQSKVFYFAVYFMQKLKEYGWYLDYNVDCEYNKNCFNERNCKMVKVEDKYHRIIPDFILHKRGDNKSNKLVIEFKNAKRMSKSDLYKLKALTYKNDNYDDNYNYKLGLFIKFNQKRENVEIKVFINGREEINNFIGSFLTES